MLSRKDYRAVAAILNEGTRADDDNPYQVTIDARKLADYFTADNPNFDRARFFDAAGTYGTFEGKHIEAGPCPACIANDSLS